MNHVHLILFGILFVMTIVWMFITNRVFRILESKHPEKYAEMWSPTLFWRNSPASGFAFMKFLFNSEYLALEDEELSKICFFARVFGAVYMMILTVLTTLIIVAINCS